jgi:beta-glucosidase
MTFPAGFVWGAATASYQIEGAAAEDGRGVSIWDTFSRSPGNVRNGDTGDTASDHYHRWREDVALMRELGLKGYRFSIAWPRVQPSGRGAPNERGLDFYRRLVDGLLAADVEPFVTLYHWDLPQALQDEGGWPRRETAERFAEYAGHVFDAIGDRVTYWFTLNEPWCSAFLGYGSGVHAPGIRDPQQAAAAAHNLLLAHGAAVQRLRGQIGIVLNLAPVRSASDDPADVNAARLVDGMQNRVFLDPILKGGYPADVLEHLSRHVDVDYIQDGDERLIAAPIDVLGINYYRPLTIGAGQAGSSRASWPGEDEVEERSVAGARTAMGWDVDADGLEELLVRVHRDYGPLRLYVTENGAAYEDRPDRNGQIDDIERVAYLEQHVRAAQRAVTAGVDLAGYFVWSFLDNFEWAEGYGQRFGLVYVDYETQRRIPKRSAEWYRSVIAANGAESVRADRPVDPAGLP